MPKLAIVISESALLLRDKRPTSDTAGRGIKIFLVPNYVSQLKFWSGIGGFCSEYTYRCRTEPGGGAIILGE